MAVGATVLPMTLALSYAVGVHSGWRSCSPGFDRTTIPIRCYGSISPWPSRERSYCLWIWD